MAKSEGTIYATGGEVGSIDWTVYSDGSVRLNASGAFLPVDISSISRMFATLGVDATAERSAHLAAKREEEREIGVY